MESNLEKPKVNENITLQDLGDEVLLYDSDKENVHVLNNTANAIWNLCDGEHTIDDIQKHLEEQFPDVSEDHIVEDIRTTIMEFKEKKLII